MMEDMEIKEEHKPLLKAFGLKDEDFEYFDGKCVRYEYDEKKGIRLYDPYYRTSYNEYINIDGWSSWNNERDSFMTDMLKPTHKKIAKKLSEQTRPDQETINVELKKKFGEKISGDKDKF